MSFSTNELQVEDMEGLVTSLARFNIPLHGHFPPVEGRCFLDFELEETKTYNDADEEFCFEQHVMPFLKEGIVFITYDWRIATAYIRRGNFVDRTEISLFRIKDQAAEAFDIPLVDID